MIDWERQTVLVTGGAGFIGSFLVEALHHRGADVVVADNFSKGYDKLASVEADVRTRRVDLTTHKGAIEAT
ncbi:MAG: NAD-dependent epimerase/dehydratase family protein, partial [Halapricum sp.]